MNLKSYIYGSIAVLLWSTLAPATKYVLGDISSMFALALSSLMGTLFLFFVNLITGKLKKMKEYTGKQYLVMAGLGFFGLFVYSGLYYHGLGTLAAHEACILNYLWPVMIMIFSAVVLKERIDAMKVIAMLCAFAGVVILSWGSPSPGGSAMSGILACVVAAVCYGLFSVLNKKSGYDQNIAMMVMWGVTSLCAFIYCIASGSLSGQWVLMEPRHWAGMAWIGIATNAVGYLLWAIALQSAGSDTSSVAVIAYMTPFLSLVVSAVFLNEKIEATAVIALVFIIGGILAVSIRSMVKNRRNAQGGVEKDFPEE